MEEIRTTKLVEQTTVVFVADDGKRFVGEYAERDCRDYERRKDKERIKEAFARLESKEIKLSPLRWFSDDYGFLKVTLNNRNDFITLIDYLKVLWSIYDCHIDEPTSYPYNMTIGYGYDWASEYKYDLKAGLEETLKSL